MVILFLHYKIALSVNPVEPIKLSDSVSMLIKGNSSGQSLDIQLIVHISGQFILVRGTSGLDGLCDDQKSVSSQYGPDGSWIGTMPLVKGSQKVGGLGVSRS
jgi:hypothetical protein